MEQVTSRRPDSPRAPPIPNTILQGECIDLMRRMTTHSVDFILTDPPYITRYRSRAGETIANDANDSGSDRRSPKCTGSSNRTPTL
jgi:predicted methyltransferase